MTYSIWMRGELQAEHDDLLEALRTSRKLAADLHHPCEVRGERDVVLGVCVPDGMSAVEAMRKARRTNHDVLVEDTSRAADKCLDHDEHDWITYDRNKPQAYQCRMCHAWAEETPRGPIRQRCSACSRWATRRIIGHGKNARWMCARHER